MSFDIAIIGAGIAGASLAAELAPHRRVVLLEREELPGYHATGRSAAFWSEIYGGPGVQPLTSASHDFFAHPPPEFAEHGFLRPRGALHIARDETGRAAIAALREEFAESEVVLEPLDRAALEQRIPRLRPGWTEGLDEPSCADVDVGALHQAYLRAARRHGVELRCSAEVLHIEANERGWRIATAAGTIVCDILVDAAGAWADDIARLAGLPPIGITAYRRTMLQIKTDPGPPVDLPLVIDAAGKFYFKGEAGGRLWLSPHDETPEPASDTAPVEIDIATAIERFESVVEWQVERLERKWAGQRSFSPDRLPVYGFDPCAQGFFWCAGQGGFGIQTSPAAARLCVSLILKSEAMDRSEIGPAPYLPDRFRAAST